MIERLVELNNDQLAAKRANSVVSDEEKYLFDVGSTRAISTFGLLVKGRREVFPFGFARSASFQTYEAVNMGQHEVDGAQRTVFAQPTIRGLQTSPDFVLHVAYPDEGVDPVTMPDHFHYLNSTGIGTLEFDPVVPITRESLAKLGGFIALLDEVSVKAGVVAPA